MNWAQIIIIKIVKETNEKNPLLIFIFIEGLASTTWYCERGGHLGGQACIIPMPTIWATLRFSISKIVDDILGS